MSDDEILGSPLGLNPLYRMGREGERREDVLVDGRG
jgi:hypothetical protein